MVKIDKKSIMPVVVLVSICVIVAAVLALCNMITAPRIEALNASKQEESFKLVMPDGKFNSEPDELRADAPETIDAVYTEKNGAGHVVLLTTTKGYTGKEIGITVAIGTDGKIINAVVTKNEESIIPTELKPLGTYGEKYKGLDAYESIDLVTGATVKFTESAIKNAIYDAFEYLGYTEPEPEIPEYVRSEDELLKLADTLVTNSKGFEKVTLDGKYDTLWSVYREVSGKGYVAYVIVISESYGTVESEALVHIGTDGKIKNINKLTWKTSDAMYGYVPPSEEEVNAFYDRLPGSDSATIDGVELVTNATNTSTNVVKSFKEALEVVCGIIAKDMPTSEADVLGFAQELVGSGAEFEGLAVKGAKYVKRIYRETSGKGYVAYVVVISENYGTVESEAVIYVGNNGKVEGLKKVTWKTSDAIYGYVPPTLEAVDEFYARLDEVTSSTIDGVELVTNATNTSTNVVKSFKEALQKIEKYISEDMPTSESAVLDEAAALLGTTKNSLSSVAFDQAKYVKRIYRDRNGNGYAAYVVVISENYGTVESEAIIHVSDEGKIANIKKLTWKTSDAIYGYVPPTEEAVEAFYNLLLGNDSETIGSVELVTNATNTSTNVVNSFKEALGEVEKIVAENMPTPEAEIKAFASEMLGVPASALKEWIPSNAKYVRRTFKTDISSGDAVAYVVVISENYGTVESEALILVDANGVIKNIKTLTWKTSDAIYGYVPPTQDAVDAFYDRLNGATKETIDSVELVTNATNTSTNVVKSFKEALDEVKRFGMNTTYFTGFGENNVVHVESLITGNIFNSDSFIKIEGTQIFDSNGNKVAFEIVDGEIVFVPVEVDPTARIIGISALALILTSAVLAVVISRKKRGGKTND